MQNVIFDPNKLKSARERAKARNQIDSYFLHQEAAEIICDRLSVTNRQFENVALLFDGVYAEKLKQTFEENAQNIVGKFSILSFPNGQEETIEHSENLYLEPNNYDLIISIFDLHWMNDLPGAFSQINKALKPDGLFMSALPSQDCLQFLNAALVEAETHYKQGASIRVDAFSQVRQLGDLLRRADFQLPVADVENRTIRYTSLDTLIADLRNTAGTHLAPNKTAITKKIWEYTKDICSKKYSDPDGKIRAEIYFSLLSGWKAHSSQQKPLKPGSATHKLADFINPKPE